MEYILKNAVSGEVISPYCRIFRTPEPAVITAKSLDGTLYVRTLGSALTRISAEVFLDREQKKLLDTAYRTGAVVSFSREEDEEEIFGILISVSAPDRKYTDGIREELSLYEVNGV